MQFNQFVWTDLSTFDLDQARRDYAALFGWSFQGRDDYDFASVNQSLVAAMFRMPKRLADMTLPSFWMSYVNVEDIDAIVASARCIAGYSGVLGHTFPALDLACNQERACRFH